MTPTIRRVLGGAAVVAICVGAFSGAEFVTAPAAQAIVSDLPTWNDVQRAKNDEAAAALKVAEIEGLIVEVQAEVEQTRAAAEEAAAKLFAAEEQLAQAEERLRSLEEQAAASQAEAEQAAEQAAALVSQMYRSGGVDRNLDMFLEADDTTADALLDRLARMEKATERNTSISEKAEQAMNSAKSLGEQAQAARDERERLRAEREAAQIAAAEAAAAAQEKLVEREAQQVTLEAQLAALKDTTTQTVDGYQERMRLEEEERRRIEEERRKAAEEAAKNPGTSPGTPGPPAGSSGWVRPLSCCYWVSTEWWGYYGHRAIDLAIGNWTPIYAANSGTVTTAGWMGTYGYAVFIDHGGGESTRYAHMIQSPEVYYGQWVSSGQLIGYVGSTGLSTGPHLHFETLEWGTKVSPRDFMARYGVYF